MMDEWIMAFNAPRLWGMGIPNPCRLAQSCSCLGRERRLVLRSLRRAGGLARLAKADSRHPDGQGPREFFCSKWWRCLDGQIPAVWASFASLYEAGHETAL